MLIGYARTSTLEQVAGLEAQAAELKAAGCERVLQEQCSSVGKRPQLEAALDMLRADDILVVTKIDRLARSVGNLMDLEKAIAKKGATLRILGMGLDTKTSTGRLMLGVLGSVAQFEREIMLERQREGIAKAKAQKKYKGRKPTAMAKAEDVKRLAAEGVGATEIAGRLGIGRASVYRALAHKPGAEPTTA